MVMAIVVSVLLIIAAYLLGSIPTGYLMARQLAGIDIREHGSGSTGATNVLRTVGKKAGAAVLAIDMLKGVAAVGFVSGWFRFAPNSLIPEAWLAYLVAFAALGAIIGHSKSIWLGFSGGKSVATSIGVLLMMNPVVALGTIGVFSVMLAISKIVSLSSITGAVAVGILMIVLKQPLPYVVFGAIAGIYVIVRHRSNIERLLAGTEPKIGQKLVENKQ